MTLSLIFDVLIVVLLAATIGYAIQLSARLAALRKDRAALDAMAARFAEAAQRAESAIAALRSASETAGRALDQATAKAQGLRDDLAFMIERGEPLADRLGSSVGTSVRQGIARAADPPPAPAEAPRDLRRALANLR